MKSPRNSFILILGICLTMALLVQCIGKNEDKADPRGDWYVGSEKCRQCHKDVYESYITSNHFNASAAATKKNISGNFVGNNSFDFSSVSKIVMEDRDSGFYQVAYQNGKEVEAHRFDIVFGKRHAQTFLTWIGNRTYELPISYYTSEKKWATSPGYSPHDIDFSRFINTDCFECHGSHIKSELKGFSEEFDKNSLVYGIDCERCHGPAINHVNYHEVYPREKEAKHIVSIKSLTRQQKLDMCAVCHSGSDKMKIISRFEFRQGDTLHKYFYTDENRNYSTLDVHGNQYELLSQSKCFLQSKTLDCSSCHNPHTNSNTDLKVYSKKCISCHQTVNHETFGKNPSNIQENLDNCVSCHMPEQPSKAITFNLEGRTEKNSYLLRTHKIAIYKGKDDGDGVKNVIEYFRRRRAMSGTSGNNKAIEIRK